MEAKNFEVGNIYYTTSVCDSNCVWKYEVVKRTNKTVTLKDEDGVIKNFRIYVFLNVERCKPLGGYSFAPVLRADKIA